MIKLFVLVKNIYLFRNNYTFIFNNYKKKIIKTKKKNV